jgi:drug/metabolite transporter (DMT)-like permease
MYPPSRLFTGILCFVGSTFCFSVMNALIRALDGALPSPEVVFLRNALSLVLLAPLVAHHGTHAMHTARPGQHFWRAFIGLIGMELWFYALTLLPLNEATALSYVSPLFAALFAVLFLREKMGIRRMVAIAAGFGGALLILRPSAAAGMTPGALVVLVAATMWALAGTVVKSLTATEPPWRIVTYMALFMTALSLPPALMHWRHPDAEQWRTIFAVTASSTLAQLLMVTGFSRAPMLVLIPFDFMRLVFTALLAYMWFGERLDLRTVLGAVLIVGSSAFIAWRERVRRKADAVVPVE